MRYKEFNANRVLEKCMLLFWNKGFTSCSISDIVENTGVNRFSLYEEFGNKEGILKAALTLYRERYSSKNLLLLRDVKSPVVVIQKFYLSFLNEKGVHPAGCFVIQMGTELGDNNEFVRAFMDEYLKEIELSLHKSLSQYENLKPEAAFMAKHLTGLFIASMSFCLIHSKDERIKYLTNGINVIMEKKKQYV